MITEVTQAHFLIYYCKCGKGPFKDTDEANQHIMDEIEARLRKEMEG